MGATNKQTELPGHNVALCIASRDRPIINSSSEYDVAALKLDTVNLIYGSYIYSLVVGKSSRGATSYLRQAGCVLPGV